MLSLNVWTPSTQQQHYQQQQQYAPFWALCDTATTTVPTKATLVCQHQQRNDNIDSNTSDNDNSHNNNSNIFTPILRIALVGELRRMSVFAHVVFAFMCPLASHIYVRSFCFVFYVFRCPYFAQLHFFSPAHKSSPTLFVLLQIEPSSVPLTVGVHSHVRLTVRPLCLFGPTKSEY